MARRKRVLDDGDSDSDISEDDEIQNFQNDPDARDEYELFNNPYRRKRRRKNGREDAIYGVFGEESDDDDDKSRKKTDWTKAPAFVTGEKTVELDNEDMEVDPDVVDGEDDESAGEEAQEEDDFSDESQPSRPPSPRVRLEEKEYEELEELEGPRMGGIGLKSASTFAAFAGTTTVSEASEERERPRMGGIGFKSSAKAFANATTVSEASEERERPRMGGIGFKSSAASAFATTTTVSEASEEHERPRTGGIGFKSAGPSASFSKTSVESKVLSSEAPISTDGPQSLAPSTTPTPPPDNDLPSSFGKKSFVRDSLPAKKPVALSAQERSHFIKLQGSFGAKMLAKMGWQVGTGLGVEGEGIINPIESKVRPQKMGIAFRGFKEKTEQSKLEGKRKGEIISDDEDAQTKTFRRKARAQEQQKSDVWKRPKKVRTKIEHKTYEQILAETGEEPPPAGLGQIIDATGAIPREVSSIADLSINSWTPSTDSTRIPEVRHNIRLIADACKSDLDNLARVARALEERKRYVANEDIRLRKKVDDEAKLIARLQQVTLVANDIQALSKEFSSVYEVSLEPFTPLIYKLVSQFSDEFDKYQLDEIIVAAIAPLVRRMVANWNPLEDPLAFVSMFRSWRRALRVKTVEDRPPVTELDVYGKEVPAEPESHEFMTPFESLMWNVWLPKVRSAINNDWSAEEPQPAVKLYDIWSTFLPDFIRDNMLDQLILPKVQRAVADWNPRKSNVPLQNILFPWLPQLGLRMDDVIDDAKRKVKSLLRSWSVGQDIPISLTAWKDVFDKSDWDAMLLKYAVPKLRAALRDDFRVNPRDQKMEPMQQVLLWSESIRPSVFSQILETEFFPKWLDILYVWLIQPSVSFEEVAQWYSFWKGTFPENVQAMTGVSRGFTRGLQLMNTAIELGPDAPTKLSRPDFRAEMAAASRTGSPVPGKAAKQRPAPAARTQEITFRSIVEEHVASHNLLFIPAGRVHERSRMPLYRISPTADGKGGTLIYILDDAVWAQSKDDKDDWRAISLEDMVLRAGGGV